MRFKAGVGQLDFQLDQILNGGLTLGDNHRGALLELTLQMGENEIQHNLGYTPIGFILISKNGPGDVWSGNLSNWTRTTLLLESSVENLTVRLFVL